MTEQADVDREEREQIRRDLEVQETLERQKEVSDQEKARIEKDLATQDEKDKGSKK